MKLFRGHILIFYFCVIIVVDRGPRRLLFTVRVRAACLKHVSRDALVHALYLRALIFRQSVVSGLQGKQIKRTFIGNGLKCDLRFLFLIHSDQLAVFRNAHVQLVIKAFQIIYIRIVLPFQNPVLRIVVEPSKIIRAPRKRFTDIIERRRQSFALRRLCYASFGFFVFKRVAVVAHVTRQEQIAQIGDRAVGQNKPIIFLMYCFTIYANFLINTRKAVIRIGCVLRPCVCGQYGKEQAEYYHRANQTFYAKAFFIHPDHLLPLWKL